MLDATKAGSVRDPRGSPVSTPDLQAPRATDWVSKGLEVLQYELGQSSWKRDDSGADFDALIVGSGYGGAVVADRLAAAMPRNADGEPCKRVAVLERGREYLGGAFPARFADLPGHLRFTLPGDPQARGRLEGLLDIRVGTDMSVLVANGVGGGSLINAGVMLVPAPEVFSHKWPKAIEASALASSFERMRTELGAREVPRGASPYPRQDAMKRLGVAGTPGASRTRPVTATIATGVADRSCAGVPLSKCIGCGDCMTGCNHGAKESLDLGLLRRAQKRGVAIYAGATVALLRKAGLLWEVDVWHTDLALRRRMAGPLKLRTHRLILAAGALGSTELLLRSSAESDGPQFSSRLGERFSGNGDIIAAL